MQDKMPDFGAVLATLEATNVRFVLIGGLAMAAYGSHMVSQDIDICYDRGAANLNALASALAPFHPTLRGAPAGLPFIFDARTLKSSLNLTLNTDSGELDLLGAVPGIESFQMLWEHSVPLVIFGLTIRVASLDDLIAMKRAANRPKDQFHLAELQRLLRMKERNFDANG